MVYLVQDRDLVALHSPRHSFRDFHVVAVSFRGTLPFLSIALLKAAFVSLRPLAYYSDVPLPSVTH